MTSEEKKIELGKIAQKKRGGQYKYFVNETFFDNWTSQMAYVIGFTFADGNIYKSTLAWDIQKRDRRLLLKMRRVMVSNYPIKIHRNRSVRLRINNKNLIAGAIGKGLLPKKNMRTQLPHIPGEYLRHFVRGYLDGDGWVILRNGRNEFDVGFSSGNKEFLKLLDDIIKKVLGVSSSGVRKRIKITPRKVRSTTYMVEYYSASAYKLAQWLFEGLLISDLFLDRKYKKYLRYKKLHDYLSTGTVEVRKIEKKFKSSVSEILRDLYSTQRFGGAKIAKTLGVHSSSIYRWLAKFHIRYPQHRINYG